MDLLAYLWLVPLLPFAGAAANALLGPRAPRAATTLVGVGAPLLSLLLAGGCVWQYARGLAPAPLRQALYAWSAGPLDVDVAFLLDPLSAVMSMVVTFVGFWIHVYSVGYMAKERGYQRYFVYLNLFMGAMLLLVLGSNYLITFVGWEGVGLCSYLLIGFYYDQDFPPRAGRKAFIVNRIGDFAFLVGLLALVERFGTLDYGRLFAAVAADPAGAAAPYALGLSFAGFVALCLFGGAVGKSAQIPLYVWLPDAMAGPTPVSALIHAATMVTAGVYMVVRSNVFFELAPGVAALVAVVGAVTALFAASIAIAQDDIKKVLAYSTVSQLGYMFLAAGAGAYGAAIFHLGTHAFFKALLFLGAGSVIHALGGQQNLQRMGGLRRRLPVTWLTFLVGTLAIAGVPGLAGFFSKDAILAGAFDANTWLWGVGIATAALTACYMLRLLFLAFAGEFRGSEEEARHLHESPAVMTVPLVVLALGAVGAGYLGAVPFTHLDWLGGFLAPVVAPVGERITSAHHDLGRELFLVAASVGAAALGILAAWALWGRGRGPRGDQALTARLPGLHRLLAEKYRVDELYDRAVVRPLGVLARFCWKAIDVLLIDGAVHVGAFVTELTGDLGRLSTTGNVRNYALYFFAGLLLLFAWLAL